VNAPAIDSARKIAQRERILNAAQACFIRSGFHAASMAQIAEAAHMSAGLIYRYFESKNAVIQAIIARQLEEGARAIDALQSPGDVTDALLDIFERWQRNDSADKNAALFLDITAEASREPEIAELVRAANVQWASHLREVLRRNAAREGFMLEDTELAGRTATLQCLIAGLAVQAIRDPVSTRQTLGIPLRQAVERLMRR
jgi:AcrR family transcriptional regulator